MARRRSIDQIGDLARSLYRERLEPARALDVEPDSAGPAPTPRRRTPPMARRIRARARTDDRNMSDPDPAKRNYGEPVYTWAFQSSRPRGGTIVTYETRLEEDGVLRCNCMGWIFQRKDSDGNPKPRHCKHLDMVETEVSGIMQRFRAGESLEVLNPEVVDRLRPLKRAETASPSPTNSIDNNPNSKARYGRVIEV